MVEERPRFHLGRYTGKMIELIEDTDFEGMEFDKGDLVVVFQPMTLKNRTIVY
jgi:hypothetical protein